MKSLKEKGCLLAVATLKSEAYAKQMLESAGLSKYFNVIYGWDGTDSCTKAGILKRVISSLNMTPSDAILVGDSEYDAQGANAADTDFLGVSYGFGIKKDESKKLRFLLPTLPKLFLIT